MTGVVIIPAYNPDEKLKKIVDDIYELGFEIVIVNDGSEEKCNEVFHSVSDVANIITHPVNKGKGTAIKTALNFIKDNKDTEEIVIGIMDADGQHDPWDVANVMSYAWATRENAIVLGVRKIDAKMPVKSRVANEITRIVYCINTGIWVSDTQTGLRAFKGTLIDFLCRVKGERYEYEMNMLLKASKEKIPIEEVPIKTIYHDEENSCSHFHKVRDSIRIYKDIIKFSVCSITSFFLDYGLFVLFNILLSGTLYGMLLSNILARILSASYNYYMNTTRVFHKKCDRKNAVRYLFLATGIMVGNTVLLAVYIKIGLPAYIAKIFTEITLFFISFYIQRFVIFRKETFS